MSTAALTPLEQDALLSTYQDVRLLIMKVTHHFVAKSGIPFDDLLGESHYIFTRAYRNYRPERFSKPCKFSSFLYFSLNCELRNYIKKQHHHRNQLEIKEELCGAEDPNTFGVEVGSALSVDAQMVVGLLLDTPSDISTLFRWNKVKGKRGVLSSLREHLTDLGWDLPQIRETFEEIEAVLDNKAKTQVKERSEFWLKHRVGLTPSQVRSLIRS